MATAKSENAKKFAHISTELSTVFLEAEVDADEIRAGKKLHDHSRGDDRCDSKLHKGTMVRRQNDTHPV